MRSQENVTFSILPHGDGSVESSKLLAMGHISDFVGGRLEDFPFSLFFGCRHFICYIEILDLYFQWLSKKYIYIFSG